MMKIQSFIHSSATFVHLNVHYRAGVSSFRCDTMQLRHPAQRKNNYSPLMMLSTSATEDDRSAGSSLAPRKFCIRSSENTAFRTIEDEIASQYSIATVSKGETSSESSYTHCIHILPYEYHSVQSYAIGIQPLGTTASNNRRASRKKKKFTQMQPTFVDFCPPLSSNLGKRVGGQRQGGEMLLKAIAPAKYMNEKGGAIVYDLTAGFGQDSMILAAGKTAKVHIVERDPIVSLLLKDAMRRLHLITENVEEDRCHTLNNKLVLHEGDAVEFCKNRLNELNCKGESEGVAEAPDVCYLDPMFPPRTKSAAVKKNMQILHGLFQTNEGSGNDADRRRQEQELLKEALALAKSRVVVKRPVNAPALGTSSEVSCSSVPLPSFELKGSINRFDIYIL